MKQEINLIGLTVSIIDSINKDCIGITGKIVDETKSTIIVFDGKNKKRLLKNVILMRAFDGRIIKGADVADNIISRLRQKKNKMKKSH
jgi:RNase P/RNase MRP subunit p29